MADHACIPPASNPKEQADIYKKHGERIAGVTKVFLALEHGNMSTEAVRTTAVNLAAQSTCQSLLVSPLVEKLKVLEHNVKNGSAQDKEKVKTLLEKSFVPGAKLDQIERNVDGVLKDLHLDSKVKLSKESATVSDMLSVLSLVVTQTEASGQQQLQRQAQNYGIQSQFIRLLSTGTSITGNIGQLNGPLGQIYEVRAQNGMYSYTSRTLTPPISQYSAQIAPTGEILRIATLGQTGPLVEREGAQILPSDYVDLAGRLSAIPTPRQAGTAIPRGGPLQVVPNPQ